MDKFLRPQSVIAMDEEIERLVSTLSIIDPAHDDYAKISEQLRLLCEARAMKNDRVISNEMLLGVAANIVGLLIILNFEKTGAITSKAISFLWKSKA